MPRSHLSPFKLRLVLILLALAAPLVFANWEAGAQRRKSAPRPAAAPAATPQTNSSQSAPKSQKINLVRMRSSDTSDGSSVSLESDGVMNKYSAYRKDDRFYVVVPDLDAQRAQSNLRGRGFQNVQVQKSGNDTVLMFRLQPGAKASVRQRFNRLDVVFSSPGGAESTASQGSASQSQNSPNNTGNQSGTRTPPTSTQQTQSGTTTPNNTAPSAVNTNPSTSTTGNQTPAANPYAAGTAPGSTDAPLTATLPATPLESPAGSQEATPPPDQIAQAQNAPAAQPPAGISQQPRTTSPSFAATLARNWWLALVIGLVLISVGLVVVARAKSRRASTDEKVKEKETVIEEKTAESPATPKLKAVPSSTTAAVVTATPKKTEKEKASLQEKKTGKESPVKESAFKESAVREVIAADKSAASEAVPVTKADIESASAEVKKLLAGESYDEAVIATSEKGTRQAVAAELLAALASRNMERRERARGAFIKHNYLDEATYDLRTADAAGERASAARALGLSQDKTATPHLLAALEDDSPEVRRAVIEALAELRDPVAVPALEALLKREQDRKVPHSLISRAIEVSTIAAAAEDEEETQTIEAPAPTVEARQETPEATAPAVAEAGKPAPTETGGVASEASLLSLSEALLIETPTEASVPSSVEVVEPPQRAGTRKLRKKQARQKKAGEQSRKLAELEATRQKEQESVAARAAEAEAARLLAEEQERAREEEARKQAEEEHRRLEAEARQKAREAAARELAEAEARRQAEEEEAQRKAEAEAARLRAEEEARQQQQRAEEEARLRAEDEARQRAEAEARRQAEEEAARLQAEEERRQAEEARRLAEAEAARVEAERLRAAEEARVQAEEEERRRAEEERRRLEAEAARQRAEEARQREIEERQRAEAEARARAEEEARQQAEARRREEEEAARRLAAEQARQRAEEEAARVRAEEEALRLRAEEEARLRAEEEARRVAEEAKPIHVSEADVITEVAPIASSDSLIERNDGSQAGWFDIDVSQTDAPPVSNAPGELSAVDLDSQGMAQAESENAITEWHMTETQAAAPEALGSASLELAEETPAQTPKELDLAASESEVAEREDEFSTVPNSVLRRLGSEDASERAEAVTDLGRLGGEDAFREITAAFDDPVQEVRNAAARSLFGLSTDRAASFTRALREAPIERRRQIGSALASSGLASEAISHLMGESREKTYDAFSLLFLMSKAGEVQPLMRAIEEHPNNEVRLAVVKLLALSGQQEILPAFRRLAVRGSLPTEVRSAVMEAIYQISSQSPSDASSRV